MSAQKLHLRFIFASLMFLLALSSSAAGQRSLVPEDTMWAEGYHSPFYNFGDVNDFYATDSMLWIAGSGVIGFDGTAFIDLAPSFRGGMNQFQEYGGDIYACGEAIDFVGWGKAISRWNGASWDLYGEMGGNLEYADAMTVWDGKLIVGGRFSEVSGIPASNLAAWDGSTWTAIGSGVNGIVRALEVFEGDLIVGGEFTSAGGVLSTHLATWDGASWSLLDGTAINDNVHAMKTHNAELWIGGEMGNPVISWDGSSFSTYGPDPNGQCLGFSTYGGDLVAFGSFSLPGNKITRWDGSSWHDFGTGTNQAPWAGTEWNGDFIAGGKYIQEFGSIYSHKIGSWNGSNWEQVAQASGKGTTDGAPRTFYNYNGELWVGGSFEAVSTHQSEAFATFDGDSLIPFSNGMCCSVLKFIEYNGSFLAGGGLWDEDVFPPIAQYLSEYDGVDWVQYGGEFDGYIDDMVIWNSNLVVGGHFTTIAGAPFNYIAMWDGSTWTSFGSGMNEWVRALAVHDGNLYAGGRFTHADLNPVSYVAMWDGLTWVDLDGGVSEEVRALISHNGNLFVGGDFSHAGGSFIPGVASWDGISFSALAGLSTSGGSNAWAFGTHNTDLLIGGNFYHTFPDTSWGMVAWDGSTVKNFGSGVQGTVRGFYSDGNVVLVGGGTDAGGTGSSGFAMWGQWVTAQPGDFNGDGATNISDLTGTVDWMFRGGPPPMDLNTADVNANCATDVSDLTYRVDFMFRGGPALLYGCVE